MCAIGVLAQQAQQEQKGIEINDLRDFESATEAQRKRNKRNTGHSTPPRPTRRVPHRAARPQIGLSRWQTSRRLMMAGRRFRASKWFDIAWRGSERSGRSRALA